MSLQEHLGVAIHKAASSRQREEKKEKSSAVSRVSIEKMANGYEVSHQREGGDSYPGPKASVFSSRHKAFSHAKSLLCPSEEEGSFEEKEKLS